MNSYNGKERRMNLRFEYNNPVRINFTLTDNNNTTVNNGSIEACLKDIGSGGLRFISDLDLEINPNLIIEFNTMLPIIFKGFVIRKNVLKDSCFEYGVKFISDGFEKALIEDILNDFFNNQQNDSEMEIESQDSSYIKRMNFIKESSGNAPDRRKHKRITFDDLFSSIIILKINNQVMNSSTDNACILDIGQGGLRFISKVEMPNIRDIDLDFEIEIQKQKHFVKGHIIRRNQVEDNTFEYGVEFLAYEVNSPKLTYLIETIQQINK